MTFSVAFVKVSKYKTSKIVVSNPSNISMLFCDNFDKSKLFGVVASESQK